jgi:NAD(P)-dependent dehydrogenase (short-subunit alcohol dehydrogenase family)
MDMTGKTVLVTGASSGIGRDTCVLLAELGAKVALLARRESELGKTLSLLPGEGHQVFPFDVCQTRELSLKLREICQSMGPLDGMVHAAGITNTEALRFLDFDKMDQLIDVNLKSSIALAQAFRQKGVRRNNSQVAMVFISSVSGCKGFPGMTVYAATKAGINAVVRTLGHELAREGIRVNSVIPGLVQTEMVESLKNVVGDKGIADTFGSHPLGSGRPRDVSHSIAFLLSDAASWITGSSLVVDGGLLA